MKEGRKEGKGNVIHSLTSFLFCLPGFVTGSWRPEEEEDTLSLGTSHVNLTLAIPVYVRTLEIYEVWHPGAVTKISVLDTTESEAGKWVDVWWGDNKVKLLNPDPLETKSEITHIDVCYTDHFLTNKIK